jgi:hypothetical protein
MNTNAQTKEKLKLVETKLEALDLALKNRDISLQEYYDELASLEGEKEMLLDDLMFDDEGNDV